MTSFSIFSSRFCNLFAVWIALAAVMSLFWPGSFAWLSPELTTRMLIAMGFGVGMTTDPTEFVASLSRPKPVVINLLACFFLVPKVAFFLSWIMGLPEELLVGMVLLGSVNGGASSNVCALIAGADVPLSVLMTSTTTLAAAAATPVIPKILLGAIVPVDSMGILISAFRVVLLPVCLGVLSTAALPRTCRRLAPILPFFCVLVGAVIVGGIVSRAAAPILAAGLSLHIAVVALHSAMGAVGYGLSAWAGADEQERRTVAFEVGMKNCALASVLAATHFSSPAIQAPAAASCIWCPLLAAVMAVCWKMNPPRAIKHKARGSAAITADSAWSRECGA